MCDFADAAGDLLSVFGRGRDEPALRIALSVPDAGRGEPGAPFAPAVTSNDDGPPHRVPAALGPAPEWS